MDDDPTFAGLIPPRLEFPKSVRVKMNIVGVLGVAGSGKDTVASYLVKQYHFTRVALADPLKRICRDVFDFTDDQLWGPSEERNKPDYRYPRTEEAKRFVEKIDNRFAEAITKEFGEDFAKHFLTARHGLQQLGTEWGRSCYDDVWIDLAIRTAKTLLTTCWATYSAQDGLGGDPTSCIGEPGNEIRGVVISDVRFTNEMIKIHEAGGKLIKLIGRGGLPNEQQAKHRSETEQEQTDIKPDVIIDNSGTIEALHMRLESIMSEWSKPR